MLLAQNGGTLRGQVHDPLGAAVISAKVDLLEGSRILQSTATSADGTFRFDIPAAGWYRVRVAAASFPVQTTAARYLEQAAGADWKITLATPTLTQQVTVTATGTPTPEAQTGASVTVIHAEEFRNALEVQDPLRLVPGAQLTQTGEIGGTTALFIRGGGSDANKVLIDGVPANTIGGAVEFANLSNTGVQSIEVLREPNSALYGADALAGVVSITTPRGSTRLPLLTYSGDGGNFGTYRNEVTAGLSTHGVDLYSAFARLDTDNNLPNSEFHNATYAGNFGWALNRANDLRLTARHLAVSAGQPNAIALYGIPDDSQQKEQDDYIAAAWNSQPTARWHNVVRYGGLRQHEQINSFGATGIYDPNTGYYDGAVVTITGANGYSVHGQALFQYSNDPSQYLLFTGRDIASMQSDYSVNAHLVALGAFRYEHEQGSTGDAGATPSSIERDNYSYTVQLTGDIHNRLFWTAGSGLEDNGLFGFAATPRASLAYYLVRPSSDGLLSGTKLHGTFGKGIKEPSIYQQTNSLYGLLAPLSNGAQLIEQYSVSPLGPEDARSYDGGVDQQFFHGRAVAAVTYFHNEFTNGVEYVPQAGLIELGIPAANLPPFEYGGAYVNSSAYRAQGIEFEVETQIGSHLFARGGYTYTDGVVQRSFSSDNLAPSYNTTFNFGSIPIGAYSPLVGARPFRIAPHTGFFDLHYTRGRFYASFTGTLVGSRDDSDYLSDADFGTSLLLPNRNLLGGYQRLEVGGGWQLNARLNVYTTMQNLLSEHYFEAFGYPALPFTVRSGVKLSFGGESWRLKKR
ncbi:MAG TPA: TonB-dependent receptor plug domain-containing protein [Terracidiphilus sp.]|nr:TonB-dependent receptor plug domain-containing protein [Terracidiphilus sp.]